MMTRIKFLGGIRTLAAPLCFLAAAALTTSGCKDSGTMQTAAATTDPGECLSLTGASYVSGSCCANGVAVGPPAPANCPAPVGVTQVADSLNNGALATAAGDSGTTTAAQLASSSTTGETTGATPGSSAALAGGVLRSASLNDGPLSPSGSVPIAALNSLGTSGNGSSNGSANGGGTGGGTSGLSTNGGTGVSTAGGLAGAGGVSGASGGGSAVGADAASYGSGAGGGMGAGMYGANSNGDVDGPNGSSQTGHSVDQFAGRGLAGEAPAMGTADPSDYFNRLGIHDDLFKIVERRYIAKSKQWALVDAAFVTQSASKTIRQQP
jgi:hypothetical protein